MTFLDEVHAKRQKLAAVLMDEDYAGIRDIVEELYPDRAHFLIELLQNAEDAGATEVWFNLRPDGLTFEHDGRPFDQRDIWGITNIGRGTKRDQEDKIGRFGVGFKAVFAYSETPHIYSPTFCLKITDLVLPTALPARPDLGTKTRYEFPFNNPKKKSRRGPVDDFVELLCNETSAVGDTGAPENITPEDVQEWLRGKSVEWHRELYALLLTDHLAVAGYRSDSVARTLGSLRIVRLTDAELSRLLWNTLCAQEDDSWTTARYRNNSSYPIRSGPSQLACLLTE